MKKLFCLLLCSLLCAGLLAGCGGLSDNYDEEEVVSLAHAVVENLNAKDYDAVVAGMSDEMKEALPADKLAEVWAPVAEQLGAFDSFAKDSTAEKDGLAVVIVTAKYENAGLTYTLTFDTELRLCGLYMK